MAAHDGSRDAAGGVSFRGRAAGTLAGAALAGVAGWLATVSLQQDFAAYFTAARARAQGLDPYLNHLGTPGAPWDGVAIYRHSRFLYPPLVADLFRPLAAVPFAWAKLLFTALSVGALLGGLQLLARERKDEALAAARTAVPVAQLLPVLWLPTFVALERGQIDLLLFALLAAAWRWRERPAPAGLALALAILGKPFILGVLPLLLCARRWRWAAATVVALGVLGGANLLVSGRALTTEYLRQVLPRAALYGEGGPETSLLPDATLAAVAGELGDGTARIDAGGRRYAQEIGSFRRNASLTRLLAGDGPPGLGASLLTYGALAALLALGAWRRPGSSSWYWGGLIATVLAAPVSWAMSLVWTLPLLLPLPLAWAERRWPLVAALAAVLLVAAWGPVADAAWVCAGLGAVAVATGVALGWGAPP